MANLNYIPLKLLILTSFILAACGSSDVQVPAPTKAPILETEQPVAGEEAAAPTTIPPETLVDLLGIEELQTQFNLDAGKPRVVLLLTMGCPSCLAGAAWIQENILSRDPALDVKVYAIWFPMLESNFLPTELQGKWNEDLLPDPRVAHFWDRTNIATEWFAKNVEREGPESSSLDRLYGGLVWGSHVWDIYFAFAPEATWDDSISSPLASGYPIISERESLFEVLNPNAEFVGAAINEPTVFSINASESVVSYGVGETFAGKTFNYAIGITNEISGEILLDPQNPSASQVGAITVNIESFSSDNFLRDERIQNAFLESRKFPVAIFTPTSVTGLPETYTPGETLSFQVVGDLVVRETSVETTFDVEVRLENGRLIGTATTQILMTDFGFDPPAIAGFIAAENEVDLSFDFVAVPISE